MIKLFLGRLKDRVETAYKLAGREVDKKTQKPSVVNKRGTALLDQSKIHLPDNPGRKTHLIDLSRFLIRPVEMGTVGEAFCFTSQGDTRSFSSPI